MRPYTPGWLTWTETPTSVAHADAVSTTVAAAAKQCLIMNVLEC
jgi:hypothetical protein